MLLNSTVWYWASQESGLSRNTWFCDRFCRAVQHDAAMAAVLLPTLQPLGEVRVADTAPVALPPTEWTGRHCPLRGLVALVSVFCILDRWFMKPDLDTRLLQWPLNLVFEKLSQQNLHKMYYFAFWIHLGQHFLIPVSTCANKALTWVHRIH